MTTAAPSRDGCFRMSVRRPAWLAVIAFLVLGALLPVPVLAEHWAPPSTVYVSRTGHTADGLFLQAWREQRALLGDPITEEFRVRTGLGTDPDGEHIVQYYENLALVYLPDAAPEAQVQALDLGRDALEQALASRPSLALLRATRRTGCGAGEGGQCLGFGISGHTLRLGFRTFWDEAGGERWLGRPVSEAFRAPDGTWVQSFERAVLRQRAGGAVEPLPLGLTTAKRLRLKTERIDRPDEIPVYAEDLFVAPEEPEPVPELEPEPAGWSVGSFGPGPQQGGYQEIVVSISAQTLWAYEAGELVMSTYVSTGTAETPDVTTPVGQWSILTKVDVQDMEGTISGEYYFVEDVPYVMYFDNEGNALHGTYWHGNFGAPMSHGCVNLPMDVAAWIYEWAQVGTPVTVIG